MSRFTLTAITVLLALAAPLGAQAPGAARAAEEEVSRSNRTGLSSVAGGEVDLHAVRGRAEQRVPPIGVRPRRSIGTAGHDDDSAVG